jgi:hypothetical protein
VSLISFAQIGRIINVPGPECAIYVDGGGWIVDFIRCGLDKEVGNYKFLEGFLGNKEKD